MRLRSPAPLLAAGAVLSLACAGGPPAAAPTPENLPSLEAQLERTPRDAALMTRVGMAYYTARQYGRARDVLQSALLVAPRNYAAHVYLGLTYEELNQLDSARVAYSAASAEARTAKERGNIENRLVLLTQKELRAQARTAIAQESTLSAEPPTPNAVAVFPFRYVGTNQDLMPVGRGLSQLMVTDLGRLRQLKLLEREQVQALVDEMALTDQGRVDPATGARSGRLLRAGRVVQGTLQDVPGGSDLRLDATVVDASDARVVASGNATDQLQQLFSLQKQVLFRLVDQMGITLSPAERRALSERPTADLQAFLAFSRGLEAEDRGDWPAATANFNAAAARDPNFRAAKDKQQTAVQITQALQLAPAQLAGAEAGLGPSAGPVSDRLAVLRTSVLTTVPSFGSTLSTQLGPVSRLPVTRPSLPETFGTDEPVPQLFGTIIIIITRP
jgi:TolB-like protein